MGKDVTAEQKTQLKNIRLVSGTSVKDPLTNSYTYYTCNRTIVPNNQISNIANTFKDNITSTYKGGKLIEKKD